MGEIHHVQDPEDQRQPDANEPYRPPVRIPDTNSCANWLIVLSVGLMRLPSLYVRGRSGGGESPATRTPRLPF